MEIRRFTPEVRHKLEEAGYYIYTLTGQSIKSERDAGRAFWLSWQKDHPAFEELRSRLSEVALNPDQLFLPGPSHKTLAQQEEMVETTLKSSKRNSKLRG